MPARSDILHSIAATARLSNVPSVISNVWLGMLVAVFASGMPAPEVESVRVVAITLSAVLLYLCGGFLNDWKDVEWDTGNRPERALPRGLFSRKSYLFAGLFPGGLALLLSAVGGLGTLVSVLAILICIALYTLIHKRSSWAVLFMGLCRALLPVAGWLAISDKSPNPLVFAAATALFLHVVGISSMARMESKNGVDQTNVRMDYILFGLAILVGWTGVCLTFGSAFMWFGLVGILPYTAWTALVLMRGKTIAKRVSGLLAGIPLVDMMVLLPVGLLWPNDQSNFLAIACLLTPSLAVLAGTLLQRITPAT